MNENYSFYFIIFFLFYLALLDVYFKSKRIFIKEISNPKITCWLIVTIKRAIYRESLEKLGLFEKVLPPIRPLVFFFHYDSSTSTTICFYAFSHRLYWIAEPNNLISNAEVFKSKGNLLFQAFCLVVLYLFDFFCIYNIYFAKVTNVINWFHRRTATQLEGFFTFCIQIHSLRISYGDYI